MKVTNARRLPKDATLILGMHSGRRPAQGSANHLKKIGTWLDGVLDSMEFDGSLGKAVVVPWPNGDAPRVVIAGLGDLLDVERLRQAAGSAMKAVPGDTSVATTLHQLPLDGAVQAVLDGFCMADYRFDTYKSDAKTRDELLVTLIGAARGWNDEWTRSKTIGGGVAFARDLVNMPAIDKPPLTFATLAGERAEQAGADVEVIAGDRLIEERLNGLRAVGAGSSRPPCMLAIHHAPKKPKARLAFVGKGIVFDSGGLSIKPAGSMETMKDDMAGAAAVSAAAIAIAQLDIPVEVHAFSAIAENLPGGNAQRPGDVIRYRNGKTVEVLNTDAEGRLVLADALCLAAELEPDLIVDMATLTGAMTVALGQKIAGIFGNDQESIDRVLQAAESAGERVWPMPLPDDYRTDIDSPIADMKNTGKDRFGGSISAALFLREFVGDARWVHVDIAGPAFVDDAEHYIPKGGTGFGVRTLVELASSLAV